MPTDSESPRAPEFYCTGFDGGKVIRDPKFKRATPSAVDLVRLGDAGACLRMATVANYREYIAGVLAHFEEKEEGQK